MKLALAFVLAICAITAQASDFAVMRKEAELLSVFDPVYAPMARDGFVDNVKEYFENVIATIKQTVTDLLEKAKEIGSVAKDKILDAVKVGVEKVTQFVQETEAVIKEYTNKGLAYKKCAEASKPKLDALYVKAKQDVQTCTADAIKFTESLRGKVVDELSKIKEYVAFLRDAFKGCYIPSNLIETFTCVVHKVKDAENPISTVVSDVTKIINEAKTVASSAVTCIKDSVAENRAQAKAIVEEIKTCAAQQKEAELFAVLSPAYAPMGRDGFLDNIREYLENIIANIKQTVTDLLEKAKDIGSVAKDKILDAVQKATQFIQETEAIIKDYANKGLAYKKCAEESKPKLDALFQKAKQDVQTCTADAIKFTEGLRSKVTDELSKIKEYVESLREAIMGCYDPSKPLDSFTCAVNKVKDAKDQISTVVADVTKFFNEATTVASSAVTCIKDSVAENRAQAKAIIEEIKTCAAQQNEAELFAVLSPAYAPMGRDGFLDKIREYIENAIANIKQTVTDLVEKAKEVGSATKDKILEAVKTAAEKVTKFVEETEAIIKDLTGKGLAYKKCVEEYKPKLDALYEKAKEDVKTCTADALGFVETIHVKVVEEVSKIKDYVANLREGIKSCYDPSKPIDSFTCAVNKVKDVKDQFEAIVSDVSKIINEATTATSTSVTCIKDSVAENRAQAKAIVEEIKACAAA